MNRVVKHPGWLDQIRNRHRRTVACALALGMLALPATAHAFDDCAGAPGQQRMAHSARHFLNTIGVNQHLGSSGTVYANPSLELKELAYLGVAAVRDQVPTQADLPAFRQLAEHGVHFDLITSPAGSDVARNLSVDIFNAGLLAATRHGAVTSVEGPNELNGGQTIYWHGESSRNPAVAVGVMRALSAAVRGSARLKDSAVVNLSFNNGVGNWRHYLNRVGDLSHLVDYANWHVYFADGAQPRDIVTSMVQDALRTAPGRPIMFTEAGYSTASADRFGVDEETQAVHTLNLLADAYRAGIVRTYIYELMDGSLTPSPSDTENQFGIFRADGTPKPAATAIHNLAAILESPNPGAGPCPEYQLRNLPEKAASLLLSSGHGTFDILIWNEPDDWNPDTHTRRAVQATPIEISFEKPQARIDIFDPLRGADALRSATGVQSLSLDLADHLLILRMSN